MELNHHSSRGAFTAPWARHCPAYPCQESSGLGTVIREGVLSSDDCPLELEEGEGVEPSTQRSARLSRPVAHHRAPPSDDRNQQSVGSNQKAARHDSDYSSLITDPLVWSGRLDSNQRPPASK